MGAYVGYELIMLRRVLAEWAFGQDTAIFRCITLVYHVKVSVHQVKRNKHGTYTGDGLAIEVVAGRDDTYTEVVEKACAAFNLQKEKDDHRLSLFTPRGAVIVKSNGWTLGGYLKQTHRSSAQTNLGIGYVKVSCTLACYL